MEMQLNHKHLNIRKEKIVYPMKKRGQAEVIGAIIVLGLIILGSISSTKVLTESRYVGDESTNTYFDLSSCVVSILPENLILFESKHTAESEEFESAECNR